MLFKLPGRVAFWRFGQFEALKAAFADARDFSLDEVFDQPDSFEPGRVFAAKPNVLVFVFVYCARRAASVKVDFGLAPFYKGKGEGAA